MHSVGHRLSCWVLSSSSVGLLDQSCFLPRVHSDAKNFLTFGIPNKQLVPGVVLGGIIAPTGIGTFTLLLTGAVLWGWNPASILAGIIAAVLGTAICVL